MNVPGGSAMKRVLLEVLGWLLVVGGIAAMVLPGPGLLMLFAGVALLARQYDWARRLLTPIRLRALRGAAESVESWWRILLSCLGAAWVFGFGVLWTIRPPAPHWWPLEASYWLLGGPWTGVTLMASGVLAAALIVYSYRRFHGHPEAREVLERQIHQADDDLHAMREHHHAHDDAPQAGAPQAGPGGGDDAASRGTGSHDG